VRNPDDALGRLLYFVLLTWADGGLADIRDFRMARYVIEGAELLTLG
jgi:RNA polymerase sigma-70 factor, ECF subfamily